MHPLRKEIMILVQEKRFQDLRNDLSERAGFPSLSQGSRLAGESSRRKHVPAYQGQPIRLTLQPNRNARISTHADFARILLPGALSAARYSMEARVEMSAAKSPASSTGLDRVIRSMENPAAWWKIATVYKIVYSRNPLRIRSGCK